MSLPVAILLVALRLTPLPVSLEKPPRQSVEFVDRNGVSLRRLLVDEKRYASACSLGEVSPHCVAATLSAEDKRFWFHPGIDPLAVLRALKPVLRGTGPQSGASTVTQQLVKGARRLDWEDSLPPNSRGDAQATKATVQRRTFSSKLHEAWLALSVELVWNKERILSEYLNRLDYGNLQTGIASASRHYFGKTPADLSPAESAFLAALPNAPGRLNPRHGMAAALARQLWILDRMHANGWLGSDALERARCEPIRLAAADRHFQAPLFVNRLLSREGLLPADGGVVRTTLNLPLDRKAQELLLENLRRLPVSEVAGAVVVIENATGNVLAMAGAQTDSRPDAPSLDGAWALRSPGSALKPFTYALALERGMHPCSVVADVPSAFSTPTGLYRPNNYNHHFYGPVALRFALGNSLNVPAVRVLEGVGGAPALHRVMLQLGVSSFLHGAEYYGLGLTLGNGEMRLLELTNAYAALARLGEFKPYRFLARDVEWTAAPKRVFTPTTAYLVADMLSDDSARAATFGLHSQLDFDFPVACKTGTSSDYRDNWTVGFTPEYTVGVWVGRPDGAGMMGVSGVSGAAPVFHAMLEYLHTHYGTSWYERPAGIAAYRVDPLTGRCAPAQGPRAVWAQCASDPGPPTAGDYDAEGRVRVPPEYREWINGAMNPYGGELVVREESEPLRVAEPLDGTVFFLDPDLPPENQSVCLKAVGAAEGALEWECESAPVIARGGRVRLELREGTHEVRVRVRGSNQSASTRLEVRAL